MTRRFYLAALLVAVCCGLALAPLARAQASAGGAAQEERKEPSIWWDIANFVILVGILGYFISKNAPRFFEARANQIRSSMADAAKARREAEQRVEEMEQRIASLGAEIDKLRETQRHEMAVEGERIRLETERHLKRIQEQTQQEIESMIKAARRELKLYAAELALKSAEEQLKTRVSEDVERRLVSSFLTGLNAGEARSTKN